ncbi:OmpH family outer membrane protein [Barnesiella sp. WM24]|jgi:outer membrane protein|uniref:OmpH family outer membrane protein n=1 Tax=Barnesiella sp. WM24 TaxID=2558278 RepID=UPI001072641D|nr:OmpH family outer membrane protein [Barnesiella sp. WM24]MDE6114937.1 OmpH family outer membrane protein [Muribaculum sp.]TFU94796.1 OmpH family outer membrane protein [Barnesiella sp. WM24]
MKKLALCAKSLMLMMAFVAISCTNNDASSSAAPAKESTADKVTSINIRYIDADSIAAHYNLAKDFKEAQIRSFSKIDNAQRTRGAELQKLGNSIQQKMNSNGYLSQESYKADVDNFNKKQSDAENYIASLQREAEQEMIQQQMQLTDSIESFIKDYNAKKHYDAILYKAAGVYFNPDLDITEEVIKGLNARYNKVSEK